MSARRSWAWPFVPLYAAALWAKDALRRAPKKLASPVVSVGSLSAGGAGKTPVVIALASLLKENGWGVDVLSRGYGRASDTVERVSGTDAARFGDEPVLMASRGVAVWVGADRFAAGVAAEKQVPFEDDKQEKQKQNRIHLLDDGFQHRQLARQFDVVLLTAEDLDDALLPAGNRREPFRALQRADAIVVRDRERERVLPFVRQWRRGDAVIWVIARRLKFESPLAMLGAGLRPMAFCAIARPDDFAAMVQAAGCGLVDTMVFRDHHPYTMSDMNDIVATARRLNVSGFVTTEKDAVKLSPEMLAKLNEVGPVVVASLTVEFLHESAVLGAISDKLAEKLA